MTVCVAALAADSKAIVCVADKALSYGDYIQWDSDSTKMIRVEPSGSLIMFSGGEEGTSRVLGHLLATQEEVGAGKAHTATWCELKYKSSLDELVQMKFLNPRLLTREQYISAIAASQINPHIKAIAEQIDEFDMNCDLLVCGFDMFGDKQTPFILDVAHPGIVTDMSHTGFHAIGSGWEKAVSRLLFSEYKRVNPIERVLFEAFDAKANAEMAIGVGYEWDAQVTIGKTFATHDVPKEIKDLLERVWSKFNRSPFDKYNKKEDLAPPPKNWKEMLHDFSESVMRPASEKSKPET